MVEASILLRLPTTSRVQMLQPHTVVNSRFLSPSTTRLSVPPPTTTTPPGGRDTLLNYHGKDATEAFDIYGHSLTAHTLMRTHFLGFDAVAHCGTICRPPASRVAGRVDAQGSAVRRGWGEQPWYLQGRGGEGRLQMYGGGSGEDADGKRRGLQWWETCGALRLLTRERPFRPTPPHPTPPHTTPHHTTPHHTPTPPTHLAHGVRCRHGVKVGLGEGRQP